MKNDELPSVKNQDLCKFSGVMMTNELCKMFI